MKKVDKSSLLEQAQIKRVKKSTRRCSNSSFNHKCKIIKIWRSRKSPFLIIKMILNQKWQELKCLQIHLISVQRKRLWWLNPPDLSLQNQNLMLITINLLKKMNREQYHAGDTELLQNNKSYAKSNLSRPLSMQIMSWWCNRKTR